jgi:RimJ/RimL family protein N-acetyltransferase
LIPLLETERLQLIPATEAHLRGELAGREAFAQAIGVVVPATWPPEFYDEDAVRGLVRFAFASADVTTVIGQTLPHLTASIGVLEKVGFRFAGGGHDPHAPPGEQVVRYELPRAEANPSDAEQK